VGGKLPTMGDRLWPVVRVRYEAVKLPLDTEIGDPANRRDASTAGPHSPPRQLQGLPMGQPALRSVQISVCSEISKASAAAMKPQTAAPLFAALGDATRLQVLLRLSQGGPGSARGYEQLRASLRA
jgi:hypothetical protein